MTDMSQPDAAGIAAIARKIAAITAEIGGIPKTGFNDHHAYAYHRDEDIATALRRLLAKHQLMIVPRAQCATVLAQLPTRTGTSLMIGVPLAFTLIDAETGAHLTVPWYGIGQDTGDKGLYKAFTGGQKYFLMKLFQVTTNDDPEASDSALPDPHDPSPPATSAPTRSPSSDAVHPTAALPSRSPRATGINGAGHSETTAPPRAATSRGGAITERQRAFLAQLQQQLGWDDQQVQRYAREHGYPLITLTAAQASSLIDALRQQAKPDRPRRTT